VIWSALIFTDRTINVRSCCGEWNENTDDPQDVATGLVRRVVPYRTAARCIRNGLNSGIAWPRHFAARELDRETEVQTRFLHLFGDFSQPAISRHMSGNSADISKRYFQNCTVGSNPPWSASKSLILRIYLDNCEFARRFRLLASPFARVFNCERTFVPVLATKSVNSQNGALLVRFSLQ